LRDGPQLTCRPAAWCGCPPGGPLPGAATRQIADLDGDGQPDTLGCSDLGPPSQGRQLVGLQAQQDGDQWTVRRTEIGIDGTTASIGRSDTVTATSAQDPAVTSAQTISCGDVSIDKDGVTEPPA
jgi:hypothetical protein